MLAYLHIPFCDSKCHYCAFNSYTSLHHLKISYMEAIIRQLAHDINTFHIKKRSIGSLFIGGGTPSTLQPNLYEKFFKTIEPYLTNDAEITSEANPNSATKNWLKGMQKLGVNRLSFGVQSFYDDKLKFLGRAHDASLAQDAIKLAHTLGFKNISLDLMYGTALDTKERLLKECQIAFNLPINHISSYSLTIEEGTPFEKTPHASKDDENLARFFADTLQKNGFFQYEVSNFGSYRCQHNLGYWRHKPYLGIGAGAVGFDGKTRYYPTKNIQNYIQNPLFKTKEHLKRADLLLEKIFLGLRSCVGVKKELLTPEQLQKAKFLTKEEKLTFKDNIFLANNLFLADELTLFLS